MLYESFGPPPGTMINQIQEGGTNEVLARRLNMTRRDPAPALAPEIMPTFPVTEWSAELDYYGGRRRAAGYVVQAAVAAQYSGARLRNPVGSRTLIVAELVIPRASPTGVSIGLLPITADLASMGGSAPTDTRYPTTTAVTQTVGRVSCTTAGTPSFTTAGRALINLNSPSDRELALKWVLAPGFALDVWCDVVNIALGVSFLWTERAAQSNELG